MPALTLRALGAAALLVAVIALVVVRPRGVPVGWPAGIGAGIAIATGLISPSALRTIAGDTWDAAATLISLFLLSEALDSNGFFSWAALRLARAARGSGWRLYTLTLLLTTGVTALLANDGAVLMLTPIFATLLLRIYPDWRSRLPFLLAAGFFADAMSTVFVPSNLTNIILADANRLSFAHVASWMLLPTAAAFTAAALAFGLRHRFRLSKPYDPSLLGVPSEALRDRVVFIAGWAVLGALVVGYIVGGELHLPVALVAGPAALTMLLLVHLRGLRSAAAVVRRAPWSILIYALGMFVVITAAYDAGVLVSLTGPLRAAAGPAAGRDGALLAGGLLALLSAAVNNLPATLLGVLALRAAGHASGLAVYAVMLGVAIGPKLTPFGSLATLLWMSILERHGIRISWGRYVRENWWVAILTLCAAFAGLLAASVVLA